MTLDGEEITCATCLMWVEQRPAADGSRYGQCRRFAPVAGQRQDGKWQTRWPTTNPDEWCGDHMVEVGNVR